MISFLGFRHFSAMTVPSFAIGQGLADGKESDVRRLQASLAFNPML